MSTSTINGLDSGVQAARPATGNRFLGKSVAMVTFSPYPNDPRPRRAIKALLEEGATVDLICLESKDSLRREAFQSLNVLRLPLSHRRRGKFEYVLRYAIFILTSGAILGMRSLRRRYDLVYVHNMPDVLVACSLIPKALGAKVVLDLHDPMPELMMTIFHAGEDSKSVKVLKRLEKWSIGQADLAITVNRACQRIFSSRSARPEKIAVVMNSPDGQIFPFRKAEPVGADCRAEGKPFVIMYHGSLFERNGLDVAIAAFPRVREVVPTAELRIYGFHTPFLERVMQTVRDKGLETSVRYLGQRSVEGLVSEIENCDLGVIPSHRNAFTEINTPTRIFEYLAMGKPVIVPATPGIQDYFSKESLLFFEPGNADDLAQQIEFAFSHPREMSATVQRAQEVYLEHTWENERKTLLARVSEILQS